MTKVKVNFKQVEAIIEKELKELEKEYDLDSMDIAELRDEIYTANGWDEDPFKEEESEDDDEREMNAPDTLANLGLSCWDFL